MSGWGEDPSVVSDSDRTQGLLALQYWYEAPLSTWLRNNPNASPQAVVSYYDTAEPVFIENLGGAVRVGNMSQSKVKSAMEKLATQSATDFALEDPSKLLLPHYTFFFDALSDEITSIHFDDVESVIGQTVSDVGAVGVTVLTDTLKTYIAIGLGGFFLLYGLPLLMRMRKKSS